MPVAGYGNQIQGGISMADDPKRTPDTSRTRTSPGARGAKRGADARGEPEKQKENQQRLGVGPDHRTPEMKKGHRGTFP
jgi:hypothetical protein